RTHPGAGAHARRRSRPPEPASPDADVSGAYPQLPVCDCARGRSCGLLGAARDLEPSRSGVSGPALVLVRTNARMRPGAAHGWLPRQTGGANCGTQYPASLAGGIVLSCWPTILGVAYGLQTARHLPELKTPAVST